MNYDNDFASQTAIQPLGSLIYDSTLEGVIATPGRTESYSLRLDPGQTLTVLVESSETLRAKIQVYDSKGKLVDSATASAAGADALVQTIRIPGQIAGNGGAPATYRIVVKGVDGTTGAFTVSTSLNAALETESHNGPANDAMASRRNLKIPSSRFTARTTTVIRLSRSAVLSWARSRSLCPIRPIGIASISSRAKRNRGLERLGGQRCPGCSGWPRRQNAGRGRFRSKFWAAQRPPRKSKHDNAGDGQSGSG